MRPAREALLVAIACAFLYLGGAGDLPFHTRGEPREGLVVREMLATGRWLVPTRPEGELTRKPPLYYWLAALSLRAFPERPELALRLPSATLATAAVLGTWATARVAWGHAAALPAALVLASAFEWTRAAASARVDMTLAAALTAVLMGWILALVRGPIWLVLAAVGAALGTLAKGPIALVLPALALAGVLLATRDLALVRRLRPVTVLGLAALAAGLWYVAAFARGGEAFLAVVTRENWHRLVAAEEHAHGVTYLLALGLVGLLPWTPLLPLAVAGARPPAAGAPARLTAAWAVSGLVFFSLATGKRSVYLLPLFPAAALLVGAGVAAPPAAGALARAARLGACAYAPIAFALALLGAAFAIGLDPTRVVKPWLKPVDAAGAEALAAAAQRAAPMLGSLALATAVVAALVTTAPWRRLVLSVAAITVAWTAAFEALIHPGIALARSPREFLAHVARLVPPEAPIFALHPPDPALRFYAPRALGRWRTASDPIANYLLVWEDEWRRLRDVAGRPLTVIAVSDTRDPHRGHLALTTAPAGALRPAPEQSAPALAPGIRSGDGHP